MSDVVILAIVTGVFGIINLFVVWLLKEKVHKVETKVETVATNIDGKMEKIIDMTKTISKAEGMAEGKAEEKKEQAIITVQVEKEHQVAIKAAEATIPPVIVPPVIDVHIKSVPEQGDEPSGTK